MTIKAILKEKNMSVYKLSKASAVPYATCNDIVNGKARLEKCSAETVYKIAQALDVTMESILNPYFVKRSNFENFKSTTCHRLKEMGDVDFVIDTLESQDIRLFFEKEWYAESFYLLAMLDYISNLNDIPLCNEFDDIRSCKLQNPLYSSSLLAIAAASGNNNQLREAELTAIPEFKRFNIIENEVRNVI